MRVGEKSWIFLSKSLKCGFFQILSSFPIKIQFLATGYLYKGKRKQAWKSICSPLCNNCEFKTHEAMKCQLLRQQNRWHTLASTCRQAHGERVLGKGMGL